ncbi:hypothetical protein ACI3EY_16750 [Ornithinimicrobium sp. LYQ92]|uniref:hypothetical protein n=1 Tax=Serinicoccus sp. LYQ92 TaxID=3378798 RepID=UPI0038535DBD
MKLTQSTGKALVQLVAHMRRDWQPAGIEAAIRKAAADAPAFDVCVAAVRAAADPEAKTPGLIPAPGPHWATTATGRRTPPTMCGVHPDHRAAFCPDCALPDEERPTPEQIAAIRGKASA